MYVWFLLHIDVVKSQWLAQRPEWQLYLSDRHATPFLYSLSMSMLHLTKNTYYMLQSTHINAIQNTANPQIDVNWIVHFGAASGILRGCLLQNNKCDDEFMEIIYWKTIQLLVHANISLIPHHLIQSIYSVREHPIWVMHVENFVNIIVGGSLKIH